MTTTTTIKIQANENILNALLSVAESFNNVNKICDMTDEELLCETGRERREFSEMSDASTHGMRPARNSRQYGSICTITTISNKKKKGVATKAAPLSQPKAETFLQQL